MLNGDLQLKNDANSKGKGKKLAKTEVDESNAGFHFIAYVPIDGKLWKLDGLERQPQNLGKHSLSAHRVDQVSDFFQNRECWNRGLDE